MEAPPHACALVCALTPPPPPTAPSDEVTSELRTMVGDLLSTSALQDAESAAYWAYHLGRWGP